MEVTSKTTKNVSLTKEINVDGVLTKTLNSTISENGESITFSEYTYRMDLYKTNRAAIRKIEAEFEDEAFAEQDSMSNAKTTTDENTADK